MADTYHVPHSLEAEQAVLGGLMLDNKTWDLIADQLRAEDFYRNDHRMTTAPSGAFLYLMEYGRVDINLEFAR